MAATEQAPRPTRSAAARQIGQTPVSVRSAETVSTRFERVAAENPSASAITFNGRQTTYFELEARSRKVANGILAKDLPRNSVVGLAMEKGPDLIIAMIGILRAGHAYLPIDPQYPTDRKRHFIQTSGCALILCDNVDGELQEDAVDWVALSTIASTDGSEANRPTLNAHEQSSEDIAYLIFTSGSTGLPKGVLISHCALLSYVDAIKASYTIRAHDRVLQFATISFDAAAEEIFPCLLAGAELVIVDRITASSLDSFATFCEASNVSVVILTTGYWNAYVQYLTDNDRSAAKSIRIVVFGGERASPWHINNWFKIHEGHSVLFNAYGPTEATIVSTIKRLDNSHLLDVREDVSVGTPLPNTYLRVLNEHGEPVEPGASGELYIGGSSLAIGYVADPELTERKFIADPYYSGSRLYRTGDLCWINSDGEIVVSGRVDDQLKIRGYLVEPAEIERTILSIAGVRQVVVRGVKSGLESKERRLLAWVSMEPGATLQKVEKALREELPSYLIPSRFITMDTIPLRPNGKVDTHALDREAEQSIPAADLGSELEQFLRAEFQSLLDRPDVSLRDDFFQAGGDSMSAARLASKIQSALSAAVYVTAIYEARTVVDLASHLRRHYPNDVIVRFPTESMNIELKNGSGPIVTPEKIAEFEAAIWPVARTSSSQLKQRHSPIFVLSGPRHGSTLTRILLGGHSQLFSPPELELLNHVNMKARDGALADRFAIYREGLLRALMASEDISFVEASADVAEDIANETDTSVIFDRVQRSVYPRRLVDKTSSYALDAETLRRAEDAFESPFYIHLTRHPAGMISSFVRMKLDQVFFRFPHSFSTREIAELIWHRAHTNITHFLSDVPCDRKALIRLEDFVREPERIARELTAKLGISFEPKMLDVYSDRSELMTDGATSKSEMVGDPTFFQRSAIDASVADSWLGDPNVGELSDQVITLATELGYDVPDEHRPKPDSVRTLAHPATMLTNDEQAVHQMALVHAIGGQITPFLPLATELSDRAAIAGVQAFGLEPGEKPVSSVPEMASRYLQALDGFKPQFVGGWSLGGSIAVEIARQMREQGDVVRGIVLLDSEMPDPGAFRDHTVRLYFLQDLAESLGLDASDPSDDEEALARAIIDARSSLDATTLDRLFRVYESNLNAVREYQPEPTDTPILSVLARSGSAVSNSARSWEQIASGIFISKTVEGNHYSFLDSTRSGTTAGVVGQFLELVQ